MATTKNLFGFKMNTNVYSRFGDSLMKYTTQSCMVDLDLFRVFLIYIYLEFVFFFSVFFTYLLSYSFLLSIRSDVPILAPPLIMQLQKKINGFQIRMRCNRRKKREVNFFQML